MQIFSISSYWDFPLFTMKFWQLVFLFLLHKDIHKGRDPASVGGCVSSLFTAPKRFSLFAPFVRWPDAPLVQTVLIPLLLSVDPFRL